MISDRLFTAHLKVFNMANLFDRPMVDAPEKWAQAWKIRLLQEKNPACITVMPNGFPPSRE